MMRNAGVSMVGRLAKLFAVPVLVMGLQGQDKPLDPRQHAREGGSFVALGAGQLAAVERALALIEKMLKDCPEYANTELGDGLCQLAYLQDEGKILDSKTQKRPTAARTCPEAKGPNGESVFATKEGNGVSLTRSMWQNLGGVASYGGTGSVRGNDILLAAILYGEMAHQDLRTRMGTDTSAVADPAGPGALTQAQNEANRKASEVEACDRASRLIAWAVACAGLHGPSLSTQELNHLQEAQDKFEEHSRKNQ